MTKRLLHGFNSLAFLMLIVVVVVLALGGRPDPVGPAVVLDGSWRFRAGDDLTWADPTSDDRGWEHLDLVSLPSHRDNDVGLPGWLSGWRDHGHSDLEGYGWYRRRIILPPHGDLVLLGPTMVDDGYAMFWDGKPIGGIGRLDGNPKVIGARPFLVRLPRPAGEQSAVLAIRTYMQPGIGRDAISGGLRSVPTLTDASFGPELYRAQWLRTIAGYIVEVVEPLMMFLLAGIALATTQATRWRSFARWLAAALVATACLRLGNAISAWTDLLGISLLDRQNAILLSPLAMLAWTAAWNEWAGGRSTHLVLLFAIGAWAARVVGAILHADGLIAVARLVFIILFAVIAARIVKKGASGILALVTMLVVAVALFVNELTRFGIPSIWFPFNIGVTLTQYAYGLALPLLAYVLLAGAKER